MVPQGSIFITLLFSLYINDLVTFIHIYFNPEGYNIINNVLLMYASYGFVLTFEKPEVRRPVSATFNQKDVADAKDVPWNQCLDHLGETQI